MGKKNKNKRMSQSNAQEASAPMSQEAPAVETYEFDVWWVLRQDKIPGHHMKEVIRADMMARGLSDKESLEDFDVALKQYGIKL